MRKTAFCIPLIPPSLNRYRRYHWREQRKTEAVWREYVFLKWLELKRPTFTGVLVTLHFYFPDRRRRDLDNYMATGSKLVGDALKGCFIPDDDPRHLRAWRFLFGRDRENPRTVITLETMDRKPIGPRKTDQPRKPEGSAPWRTFGMP